MASSSPFSESFSCSWNRCQLVDGIVQFGVGIAELFAVYHQFEAFGEFGIITVLFAQGRHFHRVVGDKGGLDHMGFGFFTENGINDLAFSHGVVQFHLQAIGHTSQSGFIHARKCHIRCSP